jgi:hypothetical protein
VPKGLSVHIGLNHEAIATAEGYRTSLLIDRQATAAAVLAEIRAAAEKLTAGDEFLLSYAGYGGQIEDRDEDESKGFDETWVCWDRQLLDDEVRAALAGFRADVRILVISDSCHAGTLIRHPLAPSPPVRTPDGARRARLMPAAVANADAVSRGVTYARARRNARAEVRRAMAQLGTLTRRQAELRKGSACLASRVVLMSSCQDNEVGYDGPGNGAFTAALLTVWDRGRFAGSHRDFLAAIRARLLVQTPSYLAIGRGNAAWEDSRPFTIDITRDLRPANDDESATATNR